MFLEVVEAAWGAEVPEPLNKMLRKWFESPVTKAKAISFKESATPTPKDEVAFFDAFLGEGAASGVNTDLESDMKAMNLSGAQIKALALSIETGQVHTEYDVIDMTYGIQSQTTVRTLVTALDCSTSTRYRRLSLSHAWCTVMRLPTHGGEWKPRHRSLTVILPRSQWVMLPSRI